MMMATSAPRIRRLATLLLTVGVMVATAPLAALACRCAERPLAAYFEEADLVFIGRATRANEAIDGSGQRIVAFELKGKPYKGDPAAYAQLLTPISSSECGVAIETGRSYVVFAQRLNGATNVARFDTCGGTRTFDPKAAEGVRGFVDTAQKDIVVRLTVLRRSAIPATESAAPGLPVFGDPFAEIVGLLELPAILAGAAETAGAAKSLPLRQTPDRNAAISAEITTKEQMETREYAYEAAGAVVREQRDGWFRIALAGGQSGWVAAADAGAFHPVADLLVNRLAYLGEHWDTWVWPDPGAGKASRVNLAPGRRETPVRILSTKKVGNSLWLQLEVLDQDGCDGGTPKVTQAGWVPAYTDKGKLTAWFHSRGC